MMDAETKKTIQKQIDLAQKMQPRELAFYCSRNECSYANEIRNFRVYRSFNTMAQYARRLPKRERQLLGYYLRDTSQHNIQPDFINSMYSPLFKSDLGKEESIKSAISEFVEFNSSYASYTPQWKKCLHRFVGELTGKEKEFYPFLELRIEQYENYRYSWNDLVGLVQQSKGVDR